MPCIPTEGVQLYLLESNHHTTPNLTYHKVITVANQCGAHELALLLLICGIG